ncbi:MAG: DUF1788 domain-containing protein [Clostridiaceae bacterium]|nr:DUF1788 domain-containing protein [Dysgonamonadaceae bacterium]MDD4503743.1 DUF1788 domain-containing protein [Clostridiaceae bacterium]
MSILEERLNKIEQTITDKSFRENKGLGNEVGYYIFDYPAKDELRVRSYIEYLKNKVNKENLEFKIVEFDLYEIIIDILKERGYLEKCFEFEKNKGRDYTFEAITKMLRLTNRNSLIINHIMENAHGNSIVFITGVGKCYPIVRSHNILNNLHQVIDTVPVVMFFPGEYSGQDLHLFGTIKDDNYYRAFKLV